MKSTHANRGTCQACGARQAVDNVTGLVAKHGYTVAGFGFFNGVCRGAAHKAAEHDVTLTHAIIAALLDWAANHDRLAALVASRDLMVYSYDTQVWVEGAGRYGRGTCVARTFPLFGATDSMIDREYERTEFAHTNAAKNARDHEDGLRKHVLTRLGKDLYPAFEPKVVKPADGKVNVKTGHIEGTFRTKAAKKLALESVGREYETARKVIMDACLATGEYGKRPEAAVNLYDVMPHDLHNFRSKHGEAAVALFPQFAALVTEMNRLYALRNTLKAIEVTK